MAFLSRLRTRLTRSDPTKAFRQQVEDQCDLMRLGGADHEEIRTYREACAKAFEAQVSKQSGLALGRRR